MHFLQHDIRYAARMLRRSPGFTAVALLALALGVGANTAIFSVVNGVLLEPLPYRDPERLVLLHDNFRKLDIAKLPISPPEFFDYRARTGSFQDVAAFVAGNANLTGGSEPERITVGNVTASFFPLLGSPPLHGRTFAASEESPGHDHVVVLSHGLWMRRFGGQGEAIGKSILLEGESYRIIGVMPPEFDIPAKADLWAPLALDPRANNGEQRAGRWIDAIARLKPDVTPEAAHADLKRLAGELLETYPKNYPPAMGFETSVETLDDAMVGEVRPALQVLVGAVGLVLLIACANVANLLLGRGSARGRELALRTALGARPLRIVRLLLTESLLLSLAGGGLGLLLALWGIDLLRVVAPESLPRMERIDIDGTVLLYTLGATIVTSILFGLVPALRAARVRASSDLKSALNGDDGRRRGLRNGLVIAELAMALVLLVGSGLLLRSFIRLNNVPPGFDASSVLTMKLALPASKYPEGHATHDMFDGLLARLRSLPGVASAAVASFVPVEGDGLNRSFKIEGDTHAAGTSMPVSEWRIVSPGYFSTMRIPLVAGRDFTDRDRDSSEGVVIVNRALAERTWPGENPIGRRIMFAPPAGDPWRRVVGVVGDVRHFGLDAEIDPEIYSPHAQFPVGEMTLALRASIDPLRMLSTVRAEVASIDRDLPLANIATMEERLARSVVGRRLNMTLLLIFAGVALMLAAIGAYGVISYGVAQRTREFGIRMALGARGSDLLCMVLRQGMALAAVGLAIGLAGAFAATKLIASLLYEVDPLDPITYGAVALLLAAVSLLACYIPARRASSVNPMVALRYE